MDGVGVSAWTGGNARTALLKPLVRARSGSRASRVAISWFCHKFSKVSALVYLLDKTRCIEDF
jgi:hypothetical protein